MKKLLILLQFLLGIQAIASPPPKPLPPKKASVLRVMPYFINPEKLLNFWGDDALPAKQYTRQEIALQKQLNELEDGVITYAPKGSVSERDIDQIAITPYTWKWISLEHQEPDGTFTKATLRRPNAWLIANHLTTIGATYHLQVPSAGIDGQVTVTAITPNQLDSRFWNDHRQGNYVARPITGFFEHSRSNLVAIKLIGQDGTTEVTDNHLFFSQTRNDWVSVANLAIGEQIKTRLGTATLEAKTPKQGIYTVYDLELYQDHNFLAGKAELLVHNSCDWTPGKKLPDNKISAPPKKRGNAPIGDDGKPIELHHNGQKTDSPLDEMTMTDHRGGSNFKKNHSNTGKESSNVDRPDFKKVQKTYWRKEWDNGRFKKE